MPDKKAADTAPSSVSGTAQGLAAIAIWSTTIAVSRALTEDLGKLTTGAIIYLGSGTLACLGIALRPHILRAIMRAPRRYWMVCGPLFAAYVVFLYMAIGTAKGRSATVVVGIINYLWPALILVFSIPILGRRARWTIFPGLLLACIGVTVASMAGQDLADDGLLNSLSENAVPYGLAGAAALSWSLYSNFSRRLYGQDEGAVPFFLLGTGLVLGIARILIPEQSRWTPRSCAELVYMILLPTTLAYVFWDRAVRTGNIVLLASVSFLIPVVSTLITSAYLGSSIGPSLWIGSALVAAGAWICNASIENGSG